MPTDDITRNFGGIQFCQLTAEWPICCLGWQIQLRKCRATFVGLINVWVKAEVKKDSKLQNVFYVKM